MNIKRKHKETIKLCQVAEEKGFSRKSRDQRIGFGHNEEKAIWSLLLLTYYLYQHTLWCRPS